MPIPDAMILNWKMVLALVAGSSALTIVGIYLLARFTMTIRSLQPTNATLTKHADLPVSSRQVVSADLTQRSKEFAKEFTWLQMASDRNFATIRSFRNANLASAPMSREVLLNELTTWYESVLPKALLDAKGPKDRIPIRQLMGQIQTEMMLHEARTVTDSAALVFAHSILDDLATQCCSLAARFAPEDWVTAVAERKLSLAEFKEFASYDAALRNLLERYMADLQGKSVVARIKILNQKCQPMPDDYFDLRGFKLDLSRIESLDKKRQDVIHRVRLREAFTEIESDIAYLHNVSHYLLALVSYRYGIMFDENCMDDLIKEFRPPDGSELARTMDQIIKDARTSSAAQA